MPNISDVARYAGVSVTTVSRVLNDSSHPVNTETRARVLEAIDALNFVPSQLARALANEKTHLIGVIVGDGSDPYFANIVRGISDTAQENGYLTIICNTERVPKVELSFLRLLRDYSADGIIFAGGGLTDPHYQKELGELLARLQEQHIPVIALSNQYLDMPQVKIDDVAAAKEMTEYLVGLGHRRIGFITGPFSLMTSHLRLEGYRKGLESCGFPFDDGLIIEGDFTYESGRTATDRFLKLPDPPTAIFGSDDREALGCLFRLNELGIAVPEKISVVGFDDIENTQYVHPPLTTVRVPMHEIGMMGVQQFLKAQAGEALSEGIQCIPHQLVIRASTAAAPGR